MGQIRRLAMNTRVTPEQALAGSDTQSVLGIGTVSATTEGPSVHRYSYYLPGRVDRPLLPHQLRDGDAAMFALQILLARGFRYAGPILNYPASHSMSTAVARSDEPVLRAMHPDDLWLITTRLPADDAIEGSKCQVVRSCSVMEERVITCLRRHLPYCSRRQITVAETHVRQHPGVAKYRNVLFQQKKGAAIQSYLPAGSRSWQRPPNARARSLAYLVYEEHAWPGGPGFYAAFGMCGTDTLVWNYMLAKRFPHLIASPSVPFAMAELIPPKSIPTRPLTLDFFEQWNVRLLTQHAEE